MGVVYLWLVTNDWSFAKEGSRDTTNNSPWQEKEKMTQDSGMAYVENRAFIDHSW